ncbi:MAG: fatty acid desaturase [Alphaproteobacteria bacterium]|nr:fatty acid desaturase [Alphaproteobacteria bacterium]
MPMEAFDTSLVTEAHRLTVDLVRPRPWVYWLDLALTAAAVYGGLAATVLAPGPLGVAGAVLFVLALYRGVSFIHELTHLRPSDVPGFRTAWHAVIGVPFLLPSLLYEGVHNLHHSKQRYGTPADPEYAPLAHRSALHIAAFVLVALLAPLGAFLRAAVLTPLSWLSPRLRRGLVAAASSMTINPAFRRDDHDRAKAKSWIVPETACWLWSWGLVALALISPLGAAFVIAGFAGLALTALVNQLRTLVAHAWTNAGEPMTFLAQFQDSINVPPPALLPALWAPVGLRYHALHHLLPRVPYHSLGEAHRRLMAALPAEAGYGAVSHAGLWSAVAALLRRVRALAGTRYSATPT